MGDQMRFFASQAPQSAKGKAAKPDSEAPEYLWPGYRGPDQAGWSQMDHVNRIRENLDLMRSGDKTQAANLWAQMDLESTEKEPDVTTQKNPVVQTKLTVSEPDDPLEKEADEVAERVMRSPSSIIASRPAISPFARSLQKYTLPDSLRDETGAPKPNPLLGKVQRSKGKVLPESSREFFGSRFGRNFDNVHVHNDQAAHDAADSIQAKAFTHGNDVYFNKDQYAPGTNDGDRLIAHELTHVVQQSGGQGAIQRDPQDTLEEKLVRGATVLRWPTEDETGEVELRAGGRLEPIILDIYSKHVTQIDTYDAYLIAEDIATSNKLNPDAKKDWARGIKAGDVIKIPSWRRARAVVLKPGLGAEPSLSKQERSMWRRFIDAVQPTADMLAIASALGNMGASIDGAKRSKIYQLFNEAIANSPRLKAIFQKHLIALIDAEYLRSIGYKPTDVAEVMRDIGAAIPKLRGYEQFLQFYGKLIKGISALATGLGVIDLLFGLWQVVDNSSKFIATKTYMMKHADVAAESIRLAFESLAEALTSEKDRIEIIESLYKLSRTSLTETRTLNAQEVVEAVKEKTGKVNTLSPRMASKVAELLTKASIHIMRAAQERPEHTDSIVALSQAITSISANLMIMSATASKNPLLFAYGGIWSAMTLQIHGTSLGMAYQEGVIGFSDWALRKFYRDEVIRSFINLAVRSEFNPEISSTKILEEVFRTANENSLE